ncbi:MAG: type II toxin-antitoxin system VapC family toxin [Nocardioides sp.]
MLRDEPEAGAFMGLVAAAPTPKVSTTTLLEVFLVEGAARQERIDAFLREAGVRGVPFDMAHLEAARDAHSRYGKGSRHPAKLNFGDCMAYALAKVTGEPLLFKGDDFTHTDVEPAYRP